MKLCISHIWVSYAVCMCEKKRGELFVVVLEVGLFCVALSLTED